MRPGPRSSVLSCMLLEIIEKMSARYIKANEQTSAKTVKSDSR
jgi:hypothetical protein